MNIQEPEGYRIVQVAKFSAIALDYSKPIKTPKMNIRIEENPKPTIIGDYWDEEIVAQIAYLLREY